MDFKISQTVVVCVSPEHTRARSRTTDRPHRFCSAGLSVRFRDFERRKKDVPVFKTRSTFSSPIFVLETRSFKRAKRATRMTMMDVSLSVLGRVRLRDARAIERRLFSTTTRALSRALARKRDDGKRERKDQREHRLERGGRIVDHSPLLGKRRRKNDSTTRRTELFRRDGPVAIFIEQSERFLEFGDLLVREFSRHRILLLRAC